MNMTPSKFIRRMEGDPTIRKLVEQGCTIYRKSGDPYLYIVPEGVNHSDAWRAVMGGSQ